MATTHTSTLNIACSKAHTCVGCGGSYAYVMNRKIVGTGMSPAGATQAAQKKAAKSVAADVDIEPCPNCGRYQPDMIGQQHKKWHNWTALAVGIPLFVFFILKLTHSVRDDYLLLISAAWCAAIGVTGFFIDLGDPNRNLEANRLLGESRVDKGRLKQLSPATGVAEPPAALRSYGMIAFALAAVALLAIYAPELIRSAAGWPLNNDAFPPVVGAGDSTLVYLPDSVTSVQGHWRGTTTIHAQVAGDKKSIPVHVNSASDDWGTFLSVEENEKSTQRRLWVELHFPPGEELTDKTVDCDIALNVTYPQISAMHADKFNVKQSQFHGKAHLQMASAGAGASYVQFWWWGFAAGTVLLIASVITRIYGAKALARQALPTTLLQPETPA